MGKYFLLLSFISCLTSTAQTKKKSLAEKLSSFDQYVQQGMNTWQVPGMSVAIVKDNKIVFAKGYGVRAVGTNNKVDTKTYFTCASTTKAMTAVCMGILVDAGKINWSDKVIQHLPSFQLYDPAVTRELTIQDLFLHNSGVGNTDFLWGDNPLSSDEILAKMQLVKPSYSFRSSFIYQNIFYLVAGKVIEKVSGKPWQIFIKENIFDKLGMQHTKPMFADIKDEPNRALPHVFIDSVVTTIDKESADAIGPAGSVASCADDIALWMQCMIDSSKFSGGRLVQPATWMYLLHPKTLVPEDEFYPTQQLTKPNFTTYAMGWFQQDYKGYKLNYHTGSLAGETAIHAQLPDKKFGIYIFGNLDHAELRHALVFKALDLFELGGTTDWSSSFKLLYDSIKTAGKKSEAARLPKQVTGTHPDFKLTAYSGIYQDTLYGKIEIKEDQGQLTTTVNGVLTGTLTHFHYNTFKTIYSKKHYTPDYYTFQPAADGSIAGVEIGGVVFAKR